MGEGDSSFGVRGEATRNELLENAIRRFGEAGFRDTSVSQIARDSGIRQAAAYRYFDSKQTLFDEAVLADLDSALDDSLGFGSADEHFILWMSGFALKFQHEVKSRPLCSRVFANREGDTLRRLADSRVADRIEAVVVERLIEGQADGSVRSDIDATVIGRGIEALIVPLAISSAAVGSDPRSGGTEGILAIARAALSPIEIVLDTADQPVPDRAMGSTQN